MLFPLLLSTWPPAFGSIGVPPLELLQPFLEEPHPVSGHVSWNGVDPERPEADFYEKTREAIYYWPWNREATNSKGRLINIAPARYPVVRVLYWYLREAREPRTVICNDCGIAACCNLGHWHIRTAGERAASKRIIVYSAFESPEYRRQR